MDRGAGPRAEGRCRREVAEDPRALAVLVRRLGCGDRAAGTGRLPPLAPPMGLPLHWAAAAPAQARPTGHHHRWVTGLCLSGAGGQACLVSLASPTGRDPLGTAAFYDRRRDEPTQAGDENAVTDSGSAHRAAPTRAGVGTGVRVGYYPLGQPGGSEVARAHLVSACLDYHCHRALLPGLPAVLRHPWGLSFGPQCQTGMDPLSRGLCVHTTGDHRPRPDRSDDARGPAEAPVPLHQ
jgi:hypothetical protein